MWFYFITQHLSRLPRNEYIRGEMRPAPCSVGTTTLGSLFHWDSETQVTQATQYTMLPITPQSQMEN